MFVSTCGAVRLAERVTAGDERDRLLVVHRHAGERLADVHGGGERIGIAVRPLGVHIDEAHLNGAERFFEIPLAGVSLIPEPGGLRPPVDVLGFPYVLATAPRNRAS